MISYRSQSLIPFLVVGFPSLSQSFETAKILIEEGVELLELGVPFSDPLADGPMIQHASEIALKNKISLHEVFQFISDLKAFSPSVQIVVFTYLNPILRYGLERYVRDAKTAGADATLTVDLPPEEATDYIKVHEAGGLKTVFLASPTTSDERLRLVSQVSTGFVYYISRAGVTGEAAEVSSTLAHEIGRVRRYVERPIAIGFGISTPEQAATVSRHGDGVVIGSKFLRLMEQGPLEVRNFARETIAELARIK